MNVFQITYTVLGGLGIFFYGMKIMSDSLQSAAGSIIRKIINSLTSNRLLAVSVGVVVTMIVQSSSVTTVMVIGFVNAGLMQLTQAIGVIFGANIGTTVTGWIISIKVGKYGLLLIGIGVFPALFSNNPKWTQIGKIFLGVGMIFLGLKTMSDAFKPLHSMPEFLDSISYFSGHHYGAYLASAVVGCVLTMIVQSSSAMLGITIAMAISGVIGFYTSVALVLGQNIGTTITAVLASIGGNVHAKRAARAHAFFNVFGVVVMLAIFPLYVQFIEWLIPGEANFINELGDRPNIAVHVATAHTIFNVTATLLFLPLINILAKFVVKITPDKEVKEQHHLVMLGNPTDMLPATALVQACNEIAKMKDIVHRMFDMSYEYAKNENSNGKHLAKISDYERITDNIQKEVTLFICQTMEKRLSFAQSSESQGIVRIADELESVADYLEKVVLRYSKFRENQKWQQGESKKEFFEYFFEIKKYFEEVIAPSDPEDPFDGTVFDRKSKELIVVAESIRHKYVDRISRGAYEPETVMTYSEMVASMSKIRGHSHNISQAIERIHDARSTN